MTCQINPILKCKYFWLGLWLFWESYGLLRVISKIYFKVSISTLARMGVLQILVLQKTLVWTHTGWWLISGPEGGYGQYLFGSPKTIFLIEYLQLCKIYLLCKNVVLQDVGFWEDRVMGCLGREWQRYQFEQIFQGIKKFCSSKFNLLCKNVVLQDVGFWEDRVMGCRGWECRSWQ